MRIISGAHRGRRLKPVKGDLIRPTTDRVREAVFNILSEKVSGTEVLDLFAGSGALGIEALSRGAKHATFVDSSLYAVNLIKANLELIGEAEKGTVIKGDVFKVCENLGRKLRVFDIIFADPPYDAVFHERLLQTIYSQNLLSQDGLVVYETSSRYDFRIESNIWSVEKERNYGDTTVWFLKYTRE